MEDIFLLRLKAALELHKQSRFGEAEEIYQGLLNLFPFDEDLLYLLSDLYLHKGRNGLAIILLSNLLQNNPKHASAWCNLGAAFRKENQYDKAKQAWRKAIEFGGETPSVCNNMATLYADTGKPEKALKWSEKSLWAEKAIEVSETNVAANWTMALAYLSLHQWKSGWRQYEWRRRLPSWDARKAIEAPDWISLPDITPQGTKPSAPQFKNGEIESLYVHGEQGVGDEIMFASVIPFLKAKRITLEVNPKVLGICRETWPHINVVTKPDGGKYDCKVPIGSLIGMFGFNPKPYLKPNPEKVAFYRRALEKLGPGPYLALTWFGGTKETRCEDRSILVSEYDEIRKEFTCVSAQHNVGNMNPIIEEERLKADLPKIDDASCGDDLHAQAALFAAVDAVVTVQQTAVHVAGGVGAKTFAIIGDRPHWRYGQKPGHVGPEKLPFYQDVSIYRKTGEWKEVVSRVHSELKCFLKEREAA